MTTIRWGRVVGLAFALEAALFATLLPIQSLMSQRTWVVVVTIACGVFGYLAGRLAGRRLPPRDALLTGFLVGVLATLIYLALNIPDRFAAAFAVYGVPLFIALNALRIAGCVIGALHQRTGASMFGKEAEKVY